MALENITDQIQEKFTEAWSKIQESPTYNGLRERYETLSPSAQKGFNFGALALALFILLSIPYSYLSSSSQFVTEFNNSRRMIRNLLRASRLASEASSVSAAMTAEDLKSRVQGDLTIFALLPEQIGGVLDLEARELGPKLAPKSIREQGVGVSLKKLNLKQIVEIGLQLQAINPSVKMAGIDITASTPDPHYFDVLYKLVTFSLPESNSASADRKNQRGGAESLRNNTPPPKATDAAAEPADTEADSEQDTTPAEDETRDE